MKRTNHINLNGQAFCIDEDACAKLQEYITTLEKYYLKEEGGKEIMADIESRIAELFTETLSACHKEVISLDDTDRVIGIMGRPADLIDEAAGEEVPPIRRKLYRDPDHSTIGGVAAGIAAFLNISPAWIRIIFLVLFFFSGLSLLIYIILWIAIPSAVTTRQKLEMHGESANITNIEKKIKTACQEVSNNNKFQRFLHQTGNLLANFFTALGQALVRIISAVTGILAVIGLIASPILLIICSILIFFPSFYGQEELCTLVQASIHPFPLIWMQWLLLVVVLIPLLLILILSVFRLFYHKNSSSGFRRVAGICLLILLCFLLLGSTKIFRFSIKQNTLPVILQPSDTLTKSLFVKFLPAEVPQQPKKNKYLENYLWNTSYDSTTNAINIYFKPRINITKGKKEYPELQFTKTVTEFIKGRILIGNISYDYRWQEDTLFLAPYYTIENRGWESQSMELKICLPENYRIQLINPPRDIIDNRYVIEGSERHSYNFSQPGQYRMNSKGLVRI